MVCLFTAIIISVFSPSVLPWRILTGLSSKEQHRPSKYLRIRVIRNANLRSVWAKTENYMTYWIPLILVIIFNPISSFKNTGTNRWLLNICSYSKVFTLPKICLFNVKAATFEKQDLHVLYLNNLDAENILEIILTNPKHQNGARISRSDFYVCFRHLHRHTQNRTPHLLFNRVKVISNKNTFLSPIFIQ